jgi:hypothetical protein
MQSHFRYLIIIGSLIIYSSLQHVKAQNYVKDSVISIPMVSARVSSHLPGADLAERFGVSFAVGPAFTWKTDNNWVWEAGFDYIFGNNVKIKDSIFRLIQTSHDFIIDGNGTPADVSTQERGYFFYARTGKLIPFKKPNPNSGLLLMAGGGFLIHKIAISVLENTAPQLKGDYKRGYDRLTAGPSLTQFIGYQHLSNSRKYNFFVGLEIQEAFTHSLRDYDFDRMAPDKQKRVDLLIGLKAGWILPIYGRAPKEYYYY